MEKHLLPLFGLLLVTFQAFAETTPVTRPAASRLAFANTTYTTIASSLNPSTVGASVTFTATVKDNSFFSPQIVNEGTVTFSEGATVLAANVPVAAGVAAFSTAGLSAGPHAIAAVYNGTGTFGTSTGSIAQTVDGPGPCPTYAGNIAYVNASATPGTNDGTTWATAFLTLQDALDAARTCGVTQIWVAQGTYVPTSYPIGLATAQFSGGLLSSADFSFHLVNGVAIYGGFSSNGTETQLSQRNWVQNSTILSGGNTRYHVVTSVNDGSSTRLDGFTVMGGNANGGANLTVEGGSFNRSIGGGVTMFASSPRLENLVVTGNAASSYGGIYASDGSPTLTNVAVLNHSTGGMAYITGSVNPLVITMTNVVFAGNSSQLGGGLQVNGQNMTANLTNVVFYNNTASIYAGALVNAACTTNLVNCTFFGNSAPEGGAMKNVNGATVNDKNGVYYNNDVSTQSGSAFNATTALFGTDPKFVNSADPDGPDNRWMTADDGLALLSTSPAINAGTPAGAPTTDIRGFARTGNPDQGAYEYSPCVTPTAYAVTGGGSYCAGGSGVAIGLSGSESGVTYQLKDGVSAVVATVTGDGAPISFGTFSTAGTYTVVASRSETCTAPMTGSVPVSSNPLPTPGITAGGPTTFCAGGSVSLSTGSFSSYVWKKGDTQVSTDPTYPASTPGSYSVTVTDANGCTATSSPVTVTVNALPAAFSVTGGGSFCNGGAGVPVGLSGSQASVNYQLLLNSNPVSGAIVAGTNGAISFGLQTAPGTYTVLATNTQCSATQSGNATVSNSAGTLAFTSTPTVSGVPVCAGSPVTVQFGASCPGSFTLQLSSASGSFAIPTPLGAWSTGSSVPIPASVPAGSGYRIRVVATGGGPTSNPSAAFRVRACGNTRLAAETSAEYSEGLQVSVSPNPTEGLLRIQVRGAAGQTLRVELFSGSGQVLRQVGIEQAQAEESLNWDISRQPPGLYLLRVGSAREAKTLKVVR